MSTISSALELAINGLNSPRDVAPFLIKQSKKQLLSERRANKLKAANDPVVACLGESLHETVRDDIGPQERDWINSLEGLRADIDSNSEMVTITDYGAGDPDDERSATQMQNGVETETRVNDLAKSGYTACFLLFKLSRKARPTNVLEMGTSVGMSAAYQAAALDINNVGNLTTIEGSETIATIAQENLATLHLDNVTVEVGRFQDTLPDILAREDEFDLVFVDGHHDGDATVDYFNRIYPHLSDRAILVVDDIHWSDGMNNAWERIKSDNRISTTIDTGNGSTGICSTHDGASDHHKIII